MQVQCEIAHQEVGLVIRRDILHGCGDASFQMGLNKGLGWAIGAASSVGSARPFVFRLAVTTIIFLLIFWEIDSDRSSGGSRTYNRLRWHWSRSCSVFSFSSRRGDGSASPTASAHHRFRIARYVGPKERATSMANCCRPLSVTMWFASQCSRAGLEWLLRRFRFW